MFTVQRIRGVYDYALYKSTFYLLNYFYHIRVFGFDIHTLDLS